MKAFERLAIFFISIILKSILTKNYLLILAIPDISFMGADIVILRKNKKISRLLPQ